tara:strand:+ start:86 stop:343 length:258 start_codon:yes stop_codon:yes gene_type:complete
MKATLEISLYPLLVEGKKENYKKIIKAFLEEISNNKKIKVETNGLSSMIFADYDDIIQLLNNEVKKYLDNKKSVFIFKLAKGTLK